MKVKVKGKVKHFRTVWFENDRVKMINQPKLPHKFEVLEFKKYEEIGEAIKNMTVRGAGAIGVAAGYGMLLGILSAKEKSFLKNVNKTANYLKKTRPTAYDLFYSVDRMVKAVKKASPEERKMIAYIEAEKLAQDNVDACMQIGDFGEKLIKKNARVLTHCNAGWLAFVDWGTALSPVYFAKRKGKKPFVFVDETRPRFQGARLTAWELGNENVKHAVIADNAAGYYMQKGEVDIVITGADRVLVKKNGEVEVGNKVGTYEKAVLAKENGIPFYVAAPMSTFDFTSKSIPIEERSEGEVLFARGWNGKKIEEVGVAAKGSKAMNPAFDVTDGNKYVTGFITEKGIFKAKDLKELKK